MSSNNYPFTISEYGKGLLGEFVKFEETGNHPIAIESLLGIELTPEILDRFGFKVDFGSNTDKRYMSSRSFAENGVCTILFDYKVKIIFINIDGLRIKKPYIKYLHQLQNLYFSLTGVELEIKQLQLS